MATVQQKWQEIANRGLQDNFDPRTREKFDEAVKRGLITLPTQETGFIEATGETARTIGQGLATEVGAGFSGLVELAMSQDPQRAAQAVEQFRSDFAFTPTDDRSIAQLQDIGNVVDQVTAAVNVPLSGLAGLTELATGQGIEQAAQTVGDVQEQGFSRTTGERVFEETGSPLAATIAETAPIVAESLIPISAARRGARAARQAAPDVAEAGARAVDVGAQAARQAVPAARKAVEVAKPIAQEVFEFQTPAKKRIGDLIRSGNADESIAGFKIAESGRVVADKLDRKAIDQGFDRGVLASIKQGSQADKQKMLKMAEIMQKGKKNQEFAARNRPTDVVGDTLLSRIKVIRSANKNAGQDIDRIAKGLKGQPIDVNDAVNSFADSMESLGVAIIPDKKGGFKPDFELSEIAPGDRGPIKEVIRQMNLQGREGVDALAAHKMKRIIDRNVTFGKKKTAISSDAENALKDFRNKLDTSLDNTFENYNEANIAYANTINALNDIQTAVGQRLDLSGGNADKALGTKLRGLMSNNQSRINLLDATEEVDRVARDFGAKGKDLLPGKGLGDDSLMRQILFADELDARFGPVARTSFQGQIDQALKGAQFAAEAQVSPVTAGTRGAAAIADKFLGVNDENAFKAIKDLLKEGQ